MLLKNQVRTSGKKEQSVLEKGLKNWWIWRWVRERGHSRHLVGLESRWHMYTEGEAKKIGVVGWVKNTNKGTVTGQVQGPEEKVNSMKSWLSKVGSPSSRIDRTDFSNEKTISKLEYSNFSIRY
ncbi:acylphosphatase-2 isoform X3 [Eptesicus fuscus]|uniref:acylphosphatase-2 isoform X3 n=1 Tax=Eptesicus fuscus TaxID=29078 RepID=UPI0024042E07|nr:acylphosphatase-2 isoform X3 [Eptesicus fuscus]